METEIGEWNGNPYIQINLNEEGNRNFRLGLKKCKALLDCAEDIKQFVEDNNEN